MNHLISGSGVYVDGDIVKLAKNLLVVLSIAALLILALGLPLENAASATTWEIIGILEGETSHVYTPPPSQDLTLTISTADLYLINAPNPVFISPHYVYVEIYVDFVLVWSGNLFPGDSTPTITTNYLPVIIFIKSTISDPNFGIFYEGTITTNP